MKKVMLGAMSFCVVMMLSSCYVQNVSVGMNPDDPMVQVDKVKNHQFICALIQPTKDKAENHVSNTRQFTMKTKQASFPVSPSAFTRHLQPTITSLQNSKQKKPGKQPYHCFSGFYL